MFEEAPEWISRSPRIRRVIVKIWRAYLRVDRATLAQAVIVARRQDNFVLAVACSNGLKLPTLELDGWEPVGTQVQQWAGRMLRNSSDIQLQAIDGTPGERGVTFLYSMFAVGASSEIAATWLEAGFAASTFPVCDSRLLQMSRAS